MATSHRSVVLLSFALVVLAPAARAQPIPEFRANQVDQLFTSVAWSPDGQMLAAGATPLMFVRGLGIVPTASNTRESTPAPILLFDAHTGKVVTELHGHEMEVCAIAFSPDGKRIATGGLGNSPLRIWDADTRQCVSVCQGIKGMVAHVAFSRNGKVLASVGWDRGVCLWDSAAGKMLGTLDDGTNTPRGPMFEFVIFSRDNAELLAVTVNRLTVWNLATRKVARVVRFDAARTITISPDGALLAAVNGNAICIIDIATEKTIQTLKGLKGEPSRLAFASDGKTLASASYAGGTVQIWDIANGCCRKVLVMKPFAAGLVEFTSDGRSLVTAGKAMIRKWDVDRLMAGEGERIDAFPTDELDALRKQSMGQRAAAVADLLAVARTAVGDKPVLLSDEAVIRSRKNCAVVFEATTTTHSYSENGIDEITRLELTGGEFRDDRASSLIVVKVSPEHMREFVPSEARGLADHYRSKWVAVIGDVEVESITDPGNRKYRTATIQVTKQNQIVVLKRKINPLVWSDYFASGDPRSRFASPPPP